MKTFEEFITEGFNPDKKDPRGGSVAVMINTRHPEGHAERYEVCFKPNKSSPNGRAKWNTVSKHSSSDEASVEKMKYADKHGYTALKDYK